VTLCARSVRALCALCARSVRARLACGPHPLLVSSRKCQHNTARVADRPRSWRGERHSVASRRTRSPGEKPRPRCRAKSPPKMLASIRPRRLSPKWRCAAYHGRGLAAWGMWRVTSVACHVKPCHGRVGRPASKPRTLVNRAIVRYALANAPSLGFTGVCALLHPG
jgi:hypothetical protein